ncbi:MAG: hypothetical protein HY331_00590 [Chloroflexi bacterium]|nr:hypothetical protein [Chloroflexota bacterium]
MNSSLIGKIEKARRYAQERDRISFQNFDVRFRGEHDSYVVRFREGRWQCTCNFFPVWGLCSHTMAMEKILGEMLPKESLPTEPVTQPASAPSA